MKRFLAWMMVILMLGQLFPSVSFAASSVGDNVEGPYEVISEPAAKPVYHTVAFMAGEDGEEEVATVFTADGASVGELPTASEVDGKDFLGWYDGDQEFTAETIVSEDRVLFAVYTDAEPRYAFESSTVYLKDILAYFGITVENNSSLSVDNSRVHLSETTAKKKNLDSITLTAENYFDRATLTIRKNKRIQTLLLAYPDPEGNAEPDKEETTLIDGALYANEHLYLTGKVPGKNAVIDVIPVTVSIDGEEVLAAYDIKIYTNQKQKEKGKTWQPSAKKVQVHWFSNSFADELNVYHLSDNEAAEPELVTTVKAVDGWVEFEADSFSTYVITRSIEKEVTIDGSVYKITVTYDSKAEIPDGATLDVKEVEPDSYLDATASALDWSETDEVFYTKFLDISIVKDDVEIEPKTPVSVTIELLDVTDGADALEVVHFSDDGRASKVEASADENGVVSFTTDSFSVFGFGSVLRSLLSWTGDAVNYTIQGFSAFLLPTYEVIEVQLEEGLEAINAYRVHSPLGSLLNAIYVRVSTALDLGNRESVVVYSVKDGEVGEILAEGQNIDESLSLGSSDGFVVVKDSGYRRKSFELGAVELNGMMPKEAEAEAVDVSEEFAKTLADAHNGSETLPENAAKVVDASKKSARTVAEAGNVSEASAEKAVEGHDVSDTFANSFADADLIAAFDITIQENGAEYQPEEDRPVQVVIHVGQTSDFMEYHVLHILDDNTQEEITDFTVEDGKVIFEATGFSVYVVIATVLETTIDIEGQTYKVTATYDSLSGIPTDARLAVSEIDVLNDKYEEYMNNTAEALGVTARGLGYLRLLDISIIGEDDTEYKPNNQVKITVELMDKTEAGDLHVVHFGETTEEILAETEGDVVTFSTDSFSVFSFVIKKTVLASDGSNYLITVTCGAESGIPEDADLAVAEILDTSELYGEFVSKTEAALGMEAGSTGYIRLFDISIVDKDGNKIQPAAESSVLVRIELADGGSSEELDVVHFADEASEGEIISNSTENSEDGTAVEFQADSFSVYSIVDAPEPKPAEGAVVSLDEIELGQEYLLSIVRSGTNFMTSTSILNGGVYELTGTTDENGGEKWLFEFPEEGKVYIYYLGSDDEKKYLNVDDSRNISFSENRQPLLIEPTTNAPGTFYIYTVIGNKNYALSVRGNRNFFFEQRKNGANANERVVIKKYVSDPYELNGKTFGIAYHNDTATAAALTAESKTQNRLDGLDLLMRADVLTNNGILLVAENSDIQEWTFESIAGDKYYIKTTLDGATKYLTINRNAVTLEDTPHVTNSVITATPGTGANSGKWHFTVNGFSLNYNAGSANNFNAANNSGGATWMNLVEKSTLTEEDFVNYSARKISATDEILSATKKDENGEILKDTDGNPVYKTNKARVIIYTRVWNESTTKYEYYAVDHDGSLVRVYDSGDLINWVGNRVNSALWEFTEYTNADGTPSWYFELENTAYPNTFLAPQNGGIISNHTVGLNMEGRQEGYDYTSIVAWDEAAYAHLGLRVEGNKVVSCPLEDADDFYFAVMTPVVEGAPPVTPVATVDNRAHGITIKMIDFQNPINKNNRDTEQFKYLGADGNLNAGTQGLLSTDLGGDGYPRLTSSGTSLQALYSDMTAANHLFLQSVYNESGYFEYDSTQNFAHLNENGDFTVYDQIGAIVGNGEHNVTREHGQFMPYNDISPEKGYAVDRAGNIITNLRDVNGNELSDSNPRKGEKLYLIGDNTIDVRDREGDGVDYFFGMELSASFTQTPSGLDNWGHDIIFEFTGDDDFWFYVDGELILDLGGVHYAHGGSVNFRTGEVIIRRTNGTVRDSLYNLFKTHYESRGVADVDARLNALFEEKVVNGTTRYIFRDYTTHTMKMFYMERGAGASNLKMRFNLASVQPGTVELTKKITGTDSASNKLMQYPYQIWYATAKYVQNPDGSYVTDGEGNRIIDGYYDPTLLTQPESNNNLAGQIYAVYKGTKTLIPYKESMTIDGQTYNNVFLLKAGDTAVLNFPENTYQYKIVECGVNTEVYEQVFVNGAEVFGKPYGNTDGEPQSGANGSTEGGSEGTAGDASGTEVTQTEMYPDSPRSDFGIPYEKIASRPRVEYNNKMPADVMRTLSFRKVTYDSNGQEMSAEQMQNISATFTFRLYLGNEFGDQGNLALANKYAYYVKDTSGSYCKWDSSSRKFTALGINKFEGQGGLAEYLNSANSSERSAIVFTTSINGSIANIPAGYTVEVRDLVVGTRYKVEERDWEIPKGFTRRENDGYVRTDLEPDYVYYTEGGVYQKHVLNDESTITAEAISDTIASKTDSPEIEIRNQEGWGLTAEKVWTDKDFMTHDPIYLAIYLKNEDNTLGALVDGSVRRLNNNETEIYWFFQDLRVNNAANPYTFDQFVVREVELTGTPSVNESTGVVTGYDRIWPVLDGESVRVGGRTISGTSRTETYTVEYQTGDSTGQNANIRNDTVKNSRPGIQIYKTDWDGTEYLSGAVFTLKDSNGNDVGAATYTSGADGLVTTAYLSEGVFTLSEIRTPVGYVAPEEPIRLTVTTVPPATYDLTVPVGQTAYYITLIGPEGVCATSMATETEMARITVKNRTVQELKVIKLGVDGNDRTPLSGVPFALYDQVKDAEGNLRPAYTPKEGYADLVTDENGVLTAITMDLRGGTYYLREKETPSGYKKLANDLCFTIGEDGSVKINTAGYSNWLTKTISDAGVVSYQIAIENTPLGITLRKTDIEGNPLSGAQFSLSRKNGESFEPVTEYGLGENGLIDLTTTTEMTFTGLANGDYQLTETRVPQGYTIESQSIYFRVAEGAVTLTNENGKEKSYFDVSLDDDNTTIIVKNIPLVAPTGLSFTLTPFLLLAGAGMILALIVLSGRKRRRG